MLIFFFEKLRFEIRTSRWTRESGSALDLFCINTFHASRGTRAERFKDGAGGAKWPNEELCTFFHRTTLFQSIFRASETQDSL